MKVKYEVLEVAGSSRSGDGLQPLTLRYVSGYVCRKVRNDIEKSSKSNKLDMLLFMPLGGDQDDEEKDTESWTNTIDRGGVWHVSDTTISWRKKCVIVTEIIEDNYGVIGFFSSSYGHISVSEVECFPLQTASFASLPPLQLPLTVEQEEPMTLRACLFFKHSGTQGFSFTRPRCLWVPKKISIGS